MRMRNGESVSWFFPEGGGDFIWSAFLSRLERCVQGDIGRAQCASARLPPLPRSRDREVEREWRSAAFRRASRLAPRHRNTHKKKIEIIVGLLVSILKNVYKFFLVYRTCRGRRVELGGGQQVLLRLGIQEPAAESLTHTRTMGKQSAAGRENAKVSNIGNRSC